MGDRRARTEREILVQRQRMRIRTVAVSFSAAVRSARHDLDVGAAERDALIEAWRAWTLRMLEEYGRDIEAMPDAADGALADLQRDLIEAVDLVRGA